jgi:hypothetical protein
MNFYLIKLCKNIKYFLFFYMIVIFKSMQSTYFLFFTFLKSAKIFSRINITQKKKCEVKFMTVKQIDIYSFTLKQYIRHNLSRISVVLQNCQMT